MLEFLMIYAPLGLFIQLCYAQSQFLFRFNGVVNTTDNFTPNWLVTNNPGHGYSLGTHQSLDLLNDPIYFTTYLFNSSGRIASHQRLADKDCTIEADSLQVLFPTLSDAFYFYVLSGALCPDNGLLKITHLNTSSDQLSEINTITAEGFTASEQENDGKVWIAPPSNYGKADVIMPLYNEDSHSISLARAGVKLQDNGVPRQINITRAEYDFALRQRQLSYEFYDLTHIPNNSVIQWQYRPPYLAVSILTLDSKVILVDIYSAHSQTIHSSIELSKSDDLVVYDISLQPFNDAFLLYHRFMNPVPSTPPYLFNLYSISADGRIDLLATKATRGLIALLALKQDHGEFLQGSVFSIEDTMDVFGPKLTHFYKGAQESYLLPDSPWWLLISQENHAVLVEGGAGLDLVDIQKLENPGFELGAYRVQWPRHHTSHSELPITIAPATQSMSTNRNTFFPSVASDRSGLSYNTFTLAIGFSVGFLLLLASSIAGCIVLSCSKRNRYQEIKDDDSIYQTKSIQV